MSVWEDTVLLISVGAALVSALAALYARWQAAAAKRANDISLHENRLSVYKALGRFRGVVIMHGAAFPEEELWKLEENVQLSEFYFPKSIHSSMEELFQQAMELMSKHEQWNELRESESEKAALLARPKQEMMKSLRNNSLIVSEEIKNYLKVGNA